MDAVPPTSSPRPTSARTPLTLAERVALYCHQSTAANNAAVLRNVPKPTADEISEFLQQATSDGVELYGNPDLVRLLLTDRDYDAICREVMNLQDAIHWHSTHTSERKQTSTSSLHMLLMSCHVFTDDEIRAAHGLAASSDLSDVLQWFPKLTGATSTAAHTDYSLAEVAEAEENRHSTQQPLKAETLSDLKEEYGEGKEDVEARSTHATRSAPVERTEHCPTNRPDDSTVDEDIGPLEQSSSPRNTTSGLVSPTGGAVYDAAQTSPNTEDACKPTAAKFASVFVGEMVAGVISNPAIGRVAEQTQTRTTDKYRESDKAACLIDNQCARDVVDTAISTAVGASTEHILSSQRVDEVEGVAEHDESQAHEASHVETGPSDLASKEIEVTMLTLDNSELSSDSADPDDVAFGEDAALLKQLPTTSTQDPISTSKSLADDAVILIPKAETPSLCIDLASLKTDGPIFQVGDAVEARYKSTIHYFPGTIAAVYAAEGTYDVSYKDGDAESRVRGELIRFPIITSPRSAQPTSDSESSKDVEPVASEEAFRGGEKIEARYRGLSRFFPGEIAAVLGDGLFDVRYTDGEYESSVSAEHIRKPENVDKTHADVKDTVNKDTVDTIVTHHGDEPVENSSLESNAPQQEIATPPPPTKTSDTTRSESPRQLEDNAADNRLQVKAPEENERAQTPSAGKHRMVRSSTEGPRTMNVNPSAPSWNQSERGPQARGSTTSSSQSDGRKSNELTTDPSCVKRASSQKRTGKESEIAIEEQTFKSPRATGKNVRKINSEPVETTPVVPFSDKSNTARPASPLDDESLQTIATARELLNDDDHSDDDATSDLSDEDDAVAVDAILHESTQEWKIPIPPESTASVRMSLEATAKSQTKRKVPAKTQQSVRLKEPEAPSVVPLLSPSTLQYLSPQHKAPSTARVVRPRTGSQQSCTPRTPTTSGKQQRRLPAKTEREPGVSWRELEEWKNVDLILNRKRRVLHSGQVGGSDVPWGEEFASIQSLKRFAMQYPEVLREHIACQLAEVVSADAPIGATRPMSTAARDALLLVKDLAFLLHHRLAPFFDVILPVVLPAVFHSQKRFLCDTAYEVLEALVTHCSSRRLVVALLRLALQFPRDDLRLVNLTCLYVEKCLTTLSSAATQELLARNASAVLDVVATLLTCKSAACQSSLQKSLLVLQTAVGEEAMDRLVSDHLTGHALAVLRRHLAMAEAAARGIPRSPSTSPKKLMSHPHQPLNATPNKPDGSVSILQRMLAQRQNRVVPQ